MSRPDPFFIVGCPRSGTYEALVKHPDHVLSTVMALLDEECEPRQMQPDLPSRVVLPRSVAWKEQVLGPLDPGRIGKRRHDAPAAENAWLAAAVSSELARHGYT